MKYILLALLILFSNSAQAAELLVSVDTLLLRQGDTATVLVTLQTEGKVVNAVEGSLNLPSFLSVREIRYAGSVVPLWLEKPTEVEKGVLTFAGVLPGGYQNGKAEESVRGNLFTLVVEATGEGEGTLAFAPESRVYLNDGAGTELALERGGTTITVSGVGGVQTETQIDVVPPEKPELEVVSGELFNKPGRVLVFIAQDKDSGIARYEVARSFFPLPTPFLSFKEAESPLLLNTLDSLRILSVRAVDAHGNERMAVILPGGALATVPSVLVILFVCLLVAYRARIRAIIKRR